MYMTMTLMIPQRETSPGGVIKNSVKTYTMAQIWKGLQIIPNHPDSSICMLANTGLCEWLIQQVVSGSSQAIVQCWGLFVNNGVRKWKPIQSWVCW